MLEEDFSAFDIAVASSNMKRLAPIGGVRDTRRSSRLAQHLSYLVFVAVNGD